MKLALEVDIVEILRRSEQGVTRPFLCLGSDDSYYYVKGRSAGTRSHLCEWMAGHVASEFGVDIPPFGVANVPIELVEMHPQGSDLGAGPAFASRAIQNLAELSFSSVKDVPETVRRDILVLDWWLHNGDRTLTGHGGNPNLLWSPADCRLVTIDHNQAFDPQFDEAAFQSLHVFRDEIASLKGQLFILDGYSERLSEALSCWDSAWQAAPPSWLYHDGNPHIATDFDMPAYRIQLERCTQPDFWRFA